MNAVCLYFQVHQPHRLRRYSVFDAHNHYFDNARNSEILKSVASKCYLPATRLLLDLVQRHDGRFRVAFSLTGTVIEQLQDDAPQVIELLQALADTGCCEFLNETYHHSLASLYDRDEFERQLAMHAELIEQRFGKRPVVFRNTELIYDNELARTVAELGVHRGMLAEGVDRVLEGRTPNALYHPPGLAELPLLLKNYRLSDDVAFRFSDRSWKDWPLTAEKFAQAIAAQRGEAVNLFMDYETFGEHQWKETGIFAFLEALPGELLERGIRFRTPSELIDACTPVGAYDVPETISWADTERDLSAWVGNAMQSSALRELYKLREPVLASGDERLIADWRRMTISDHFYYMCTKYFEDGAVHKYFNPYESPYDSYINFMNVLDNLRTRLDVGSRV